MHRRAFAKRRARRRLWQKRRARRRLWHLEWDGRARDAHFDAHRLASSDGLGTTRTGSKGRGRMEADPDDGSLGSTSSGSGGSAMMLGTPHSGAKRRRPRALMEDGHGSGLLALKKRQMLHMPAVRVACASFVSRPSHELVAARSLTSTDPTRTYRTPWRRTALQQPSGPAMAPQRQAHAPPSPPWGHGPPRPRAWTRANPCRQQPQLQQQRWRPRWRRVHDQRRRLRWRRPRRRGWTSSSRWTSAAATWRRRPRRRRRQRRPSPWTRLEGCSPSRPPLRRAEGPGGST